MLHKRRTWCISPVASPEELADKLSEHTWTLCTAFLLHDYLFVNDATSEGGAQEYAVLRKLPDGTWLQIESITFSWCSPVKALDYVRRIIAGEFDQADYAVSVKPQLETPAEHGRCPACA